MDGKTKLQNVRKEISNKLGHIFYRVDNITVRRTNFPSRDVEIPDRRVDNGPQSDSSHMMNSIDSNVFDTVLSMCGKRDYGRSLYIFHPRDSYLWDPMNFFL